jgi:hypothetical protein
MFVKTCTCSINPNYFFKKKILHHFSIWYIYGYDMKRKFRLVVIATLSIWDERKHLHLKCFPLNKYLFFTDSVFLVEHFFKGVNIAIVFIMPHNECFVFIFYFFPSILNIYIYIYIYILFFF